MPAPQVSPIQVFARVAQQAGLLGDVFEKRRSLVPLVSALGGIRAERLDQAHLVLAARLSDYEPDHLLRTLHEKKTLVRALGVRGFYQVVPVEELPLHLAALAPTAQRWLKFLNTRSKLAAPARFRLLKRLCPETVSRDALKDAFPDANMRAFLIREACAAGHLIWKDGDGPLAEFAWTETWLGRTVEPAWDLQEFLGRFLSTFGPLGASDVASWLGVTVAAARRLMSKHRVAEIQVEGLPLSLFMLPDDVEGLLRTRKSQGKGLVVVPPGDPLRIAHRTRLGLGEDPGEDEGSAILDGLPVAAWTLGRGELTVRFVSGAPEKRILTAIHALLDRAGLPSGIVQETG